jgi:hypothetical protein
MILEEKDVDPDCSEDKEEVNEEAEPQPRDIEGQESKESALGSVDDSALKKPSNDDADAKKEATPTTQPETKQAIIYEPNEEEQEMEYQAKLAVFQRTLQRARIATCLSAAFMCLFSVLLIARGFRSMTDVIKSGQVDIPNLLALTEPAQNATAQYAVGAKETINLRIEVIEKLIECDFDLSNLKDIGFNSSFGSVRLHLTEKIALDINITEALYRLNETLNNATTFADIMISIDDSLFDLNNNLNTMDVLLNDIDTWWYNPSQSVRHHYGCHGHQLRGQRSLGVERQTAPAAKKGQPLVCPSHLFTLAFRFHHDFYYMFDCLGGFFRFLYCRPSEPG